MTSQEMLGRWLRRLRGPGGVVCDRTLASFRREPRCALVDTTSCLPDGTDERIGAARRLRWIALAFAPSSLMLAVTTFVSTDIAAVPLALDRAARVVPVDVRPRLQFADAYSQRPRRSRTAGFLLVLVFLLILRVTGPMALVMPIHLTGLLPVGAHVSSGTRGRPSTPTHLTEFYFWIALGGNLGSLFNTLVAPLIFTGIVEYPVVLVLVALLRRVPDAVERNQKPWTFAFPVAAGVLTLAVMIWGSRLQDPSHPVWPAVPGGIPEPSCVENACAVRARHRVDADRIHISQRRVRDGAAR